MRNKFNLKNLATKDEGFTLLEVLVAAVISSILMLMIYAAHRNILFAVKNTSEVAEFYENVNRAINLIDSDISCAYYLKNNKKNFFIGQNNYETPYAGNLHFLSVNQNDYLISSSVENHQPLTDIHEIKYFLEEDPEIDELYRLYRAEEIHYDGDKETIGKKELLLENVTDLRFQFTSRKHWQKNWDSTRNKRLPKAVKTTLKVKNFKAEEETFNFVSRVNMKE